MNGSVKVLLFMVLVLPNVFNSQARHRRDKSDVYKAFKNCKTAVCAARVSFCIIMEDCGCGAEAGDVCKCCEDCYRCLGAHLWIHCCDCVGLCGKISLNNTENGVKIPSKSGDLPGEALPSLFEAMSHGSHFPIAFITRPLKGGALKNDSSSDKLQCKVAFFDTCIAREDCLNACSSMGAHRYRWFRNGCCQCIDNRCLDYGELKPLCKKCQSI